MAGEVEAKHPRTGRRWVHQMVESNAGAADNRVDNRVDNRAGSVTGDDGSKANQAQRRHLVSAIVVDRSPLFRAGLVHILNDTRFRVVATASCLVDLSPRVLSGDRCLLLLGVDGDADTQLPELPSLREQNGGLRVIVLADSIAVPDPFAAISAGGDSYLLKNDVTPEILLKALEVVLLGAVVLPRQLIDRKLSAKPSSETAGLLDNASRPADLIQPNAPIAAVATGATSPRSNGLSNREHAILLRLMQGASNKHIARELDIAEATVKIHVKNLLRKIQVRNRTQAAMWGINHLERE